MVGPVTHAIVGYGGEVGYPLTPPQSHYREDWSMSKSLRFVGLDVHKDSIVIAVAEEGRCPAEVYGEILNDWETLRKTLRRLGKGHS